MTPKDQIGRVAPPQNHTANAEPIVYVTQLNGRSLIHDAGSPSVTRSVS
jgi:hypothetical protein